MQLTREVTVTVESGELLELVIEALYLRARASTGRDRVMSSALGHLPGRSDVEAVKQANKYADAASLPHIKVGEFRKWLPKVLSETLAGFLDERDK